MRAESLRHAFDAYAIPCRLMKTTPGKQGQPHPTPTLVHVARLAGVGLGTASRALSGQGYVSEATLKRIVSAAEQLGYQKNELARSLKSRRTGAIGLVVPDIGGPFMATCVRAIQGVLRLKGYISIITFTDGQENVEAEELDYLFRHQVDGVIIVPAAGKSPHFRSRQYARAPIVAFDQPIEEEGYDAVLVNNRQAAREATEHLIAHGHERIGCIGVNRHLYSVQRRIEGYRSAMKAAGLVPSLELTDSTFEKIGDQIDSWLKGKDRPTALFSLTELTSLGVVERLAMRGVRMPEDIAFIGFDDIPLGPYLSTPLTVVSQPATELGEQAAARLLARIDNPNGAPAVREMLKASLILRRSCGCHPTPA